MGSLWLSDLIKLVVEFVFEHTSAVVSVGNSWDSICCSF